MLVTTDWNATLREEAVLAASTEAIIVFVTTLASGIIVNDEATTRAGQNGFIEGVAALEFALTISTRVAFYTVITFAGFSIENIVFWAA